MENLTELGIIRELLDANLPLKINNKGKMIRAKIGLNFLKLVQAEIDDNFLNFLAVIELIHNASLFHDDVIDNGENRRNQPSANKVYGEKQSILYGNLTLSNALSLIIKLKNEQLLTEFNNCVKKMCFGELMQQEQINKIPTINEYIKKTRLKTASLFKFMMNGLSILLDNNYKTEFESFGDNFGIGFQISNDLKDFSNGVENSEDVKNGIFTAPIIYAKSVKIDDMAIDKTKSLIDNYLKRANAILDKWDESEYKTALNGVIECLKT